MINPFTHRKILDQWMVSSKDTLGFGMSLPVKVDQKDQNKVAIDWEQARVEDEQQTAARREALASGGGAAGAAQGATPVIDMQNDPELRHKIEQVLGRKLTPGTTETIAENDPALQMRIMQVVQEHAAQKAAAGAGAGGFASDSGGGDPEGEKIAQIERLAALKASGALSEEEFEAEKKILGG